MAYSADHRIRALLVDQTLGSAFEHRANRVRQLQYMYPNDWEARLAEMQSTGFRDPSGPVLY
eukprot:5227700-Alexandrium_andersonii.AAC.1